jgi:hypothetical protein
MLNLHGSAGPAPSAFHSELLRSDALTNIGGGADV